MTNAYSGNNGRAAIANDSGRHALIYTAGNAGNGSNPQPAGVVLGAGAQIMRPALARAAQHPGTPTPVGSFSVAQLGDKPDKIGKDDNFRGETIYNNVLYYTKGRAQTVSTPSISSIRPERRVRTGWGSQSRAPGCRQSR